MSSRVRPQGRRRHVRSGAARGFSLIELMVVVVIIGIIAALAVPSMVQARLDRNAYDDAGAIMELFRNARTRSVARGGAVVIQMSASPTNSPADRGTFMEYEAVQANPGSTTTFQIPVSTCKTPQIWTPLDSTNHGVQLVDGVNLNGAIEGDANIFTTIFSYIGSATGTPITAGWICFTPLGHTYLSASTTSPIFDGALPVTGPLEFKVFRSNDGGTTASGTIRSVLLPPNGMARVFSHQ